MYRMFPFILFAVFAAFCTGCTTCSLPGQTEYSLLLQENQRLEQALYITHAQLADAKRENASLRNEPGTESVMPISAVQPPVRTKSGVIESNDAPPFETPKVEIPLDEPGSTVPPDSLNNSMPLPDAPTRDEALVPPTWSPVR